MTVHNNSPSVHRLFANSKSLIGYGFSTYIYNCSHIDTHSDRNFGAHKGLFVNRRKIGIKPKSRRGLGVREQVVNSVNTKSLVHKSRTLSVLSGVR